MGKILIIPDTHGRRFWKDPCLNHKNEFEKIVFLGDFVSPYPDEGITNEAAIEVISSSNIRKNRGVIASVVFF